MSCSRWSRALRTDEERTRARTSRELGQELWLALTQREQEVCRRCAKGLINKQIATEIGTTESTVQAQRARAWKKLGISALPELVVLLNQLGDDG